MAPDLLVFSRMMIGSVLGFALYYYMIKHMETGHIALITLVTPVLALLLGHGLNDEAVLPQVWLGTASIILGLCLHRWGGHWLSYLPINRKNRMVARVGNHAAVHPKHKAFWGIDHVAGLGAATIKKLNSPFS